MGSCVGKTTPGRLFFFNEESVPTLSVPGLKNADAGQFFVFIFGSTRCSSNPFPLVLSPAKAEKCLSASFLCLRVFHRAEPLHLRLALLW